MNPVEFVLLALGGNALLIAVLGYLARSLMSQFLTKDVERFKASLSQASTAAAEELKHRLSLTAHEHNVRFTRLHEKQAQVLEEIYAKLLAFEGASAALAYKSSDTTVELIEPAFRAAEDAGKALEQHIQRHQIYLPVATSDNLAAMLEQIFALLADCSFSLLTRKLGDEGQSVAGPQQAREAWARVHDYLIRQAPNVRKSVEIEFRRLLGTAAQPEEETKLHQDPALEAVAK
jgi:hypothetical protein